MSYLLAEMPPKHRVTIKKSVLEFRAGSTCLTAINTTNCLYFTYTNGRNQNDLFLDYWNYFQFGYFHIKKKLPTQWGNLRAGLHDYSIHLPQAIGQPLMSIPAWLQMLYLSLRSIVTLPGMKSMCRYSLSLYVVSPR